LSQPIPAAYKHADGKKIDGRRVLVDVERGRTVKGWLPRRLGGGLGNTRKGGADVNVRHSGRDDRGRDRSRERDRDRRRDRSRSRDRRKRSRSRDRRRDRSRSRDRRRRSRSRDRKRSKRSRSRSRDRERRREKREKAERGGDGAEGFRVKEEPADTGYNSYDYQGVNVKQEKLEEENGDGANHANDGGQDAQYDGY